MATRRGRGGVQIPIRLDKSQADRDARELGSDIKQSIQPVVDVFGAAKTAVALLGSTLSRLHGLTRDAISAGAEQERVEVQLTRALQQRGKFAAQDLALIQEQNQARQQLVGIADEQQLQLQTTAGLLGVQAKDLNLVTEATLGLVAVTGGSLGLNEAMRVTAKLYQGNVGALKEYGITAKTAREGLDLLGGKFRTTATGEEFFAQKTARLEANFADLIETMGRAVTDNADAREFIDDLSSSTLSWIQGIKDNGPEAQRQISAFVTELRALGGWIKDNKDGLTTLAGLFVAAKAVGSAAGIYGAIKGAGIGTMLGAVGSKAAGVLGGAGSVGVGGAAVVATGGLFGAFSSVTGLGDMRRRAREDAARREADSYAVEKNTPRFQTVLEQGTVDFEALDFEGGAGGLLISAKKSDATKRNREAERRAMEEKKRAEDEFLEFLRDHRETRLSIEELDFQRRQNLRDLDLEMEAIAIKNQRDQVEERARIQYDGFTTKTEMDKAHLKQQKSFNEALKTSVGHGLGDFAATLGSAIAGAQATAQAALGGFVSSMAQQFGGMLIALGSAAIAGGKASTVAPWLLPIFGGPPGVAGGIALVAAGGLLSGLGSAAGAAIRGAGGGGGGGSPSAPRAPLAEVPSLDAGQDARFRGPTGNLGGGRVTLINVNIDGSRGFMVGTDEQVARWLAQLMGGHAAFAA